MNHLKENPVGIDMKVDRIQKCIYPILSEKWHGLECYGRVYKNVDKSGGVSLDVYLNNGDYKCMPGDDGNEIFFVQGDSPSGNPWNITNDLWAVFKVDITNYGNNRQDEQIHKDAMNAVLMAVPGKEVKGLEYSHENLSRIFTGYLDSGNSQFLDVHPYHVFAIKMQVDYILNDNKC